MKTKKIKLMPHKRPTQKRSMQMYEDILEAAIRVLEKNPGSAFTTIRVAEKAGISVGSLYQYFPNKAAILFELQMREAFETTQNMLSILNDESMPPMIRLEQALQFFFLSEWEERQMRTSLQAALSDLKTSKEFIAIQDEFQIHIKNFFHKHFANNIDTKYFCFLVSTLAESLSTQITDAKTFHLWSNQSIAMIMEQVK